MPLNLQDRRVIKLLYFFAYDMTWRTAILLTIVTALIQMTLVMSQTTLVTQIILIDDKNDTFNTSDTSNTDDTHDTEDKSDKGDTGDIERSVQSSIPHLYSSNLFLTATVVEKRESTRVEYSCWTCLRSSSSWGEGRQGGEEEGGTKNGGGVRGGGREEEEGGGGGGGGREDLILQYSAGYTKEKKILYNVLQRKREEEEERGRGTSKIHIGLWRLNASKLVFEILIYNDHIRLGGIPRTELGLTCERSACSSSDILVRSAVISE